MELGGGHAALDVPGVVVLPGVVEVELVVDPLLVEVEPDVPGVVLQGAPAGLLPGVVLGFTVEGVVVVPGVGDIVEFVPGTVDGVVLGVVGEVVLPDGVEVPAGGVAVLPCGVAVLPCGVAVLGAGVAVPGAGVAVPGVCVVAPELPAVEPPAGALCATIQLALNNSTENRVNFFANIPKPPNASRM